MFGLFKKNKPQEEREKLWNTPTVVLKLPSTMQALTTLLNDQTVILQTLLAIQSEVDYLKSSMAQLNDDTKIYHGFTEENHSLRWRVSEIEAEIEKLKGG